MPFIGPPPCFSPTRFAPVNLVPSSPFRFPPPLFNVSLYPSRANQAPTLERGPPAGYSNPSWLLQTFSLLLPLYSPPLCFLFVCIVYFLSPPFHLLLFLALFFFSVFCLCCPVPSGPFSLAQWHPCPPVPARPTPVFFPLFVSGPLWEQHCFVVPVTGI